MKAIARAICAPIVFGGGSGGGGGEFEQFARHDVGRRRRLMLAVARR